MPLCCVTHDNLCTYRPQHVYRFINFATHYMTTIEFFVFRQVRGSIFRGKKKTRDSSFQEYIGELSVVCRRSKKEEIINPK